MMTSSNKLRNKKWKSISHNIWISHKEEPSLKVRMQKSVFESQNNINIWIGFYEQTWQKMNFKPGSSLVRSVKLNIFRGSARGAWEAMPHCTLGCEFSKL